MDLTNSNLPTFTIDSEEKSHNAIFQKPSIKSYATRVFQESTVGIVSSIFTTHSKNRRFFKVFLSSLCIAGFIYHCVTFMNHVLGYPEVVNFSLNRSKTYDRPAYTFCNNNPVRRSVFCNEYPQHCVKPTVEFCSKYFPYCGDDINATLVPKKEYYNLLLRDINAGWLLKAGSISDVLNINRSFHVLKSIFDFHFYTEDDISGPYVRFDGISNAMKLCFSIHSRVESNQQPLQKIRSDLIILDENLSFYINGTEMMNPKSEPGVYLSVHSPFEVENPLDKGMFLKGGSTYDIYVEMQEEISLKAPFESNCLDYEELWRKNNRTGPRTKMMCKRKCGLDISILKEGCVPYHTYYPYKGRRCDYDIFSNLETASLISKMESIMKLLKECISSCLDECRSSKYTTEYIVRDNTVRKEPEDEYTPYKREFHYTMICPWWICFSYCQKITNFSVTPAEENGCDTKAQTFYYDDETITHSRIEARFKLSNEEVKVLRHSPKYETVDVISAIGGFMGCWLGIALLDILDFFGSAISVCRYAFGKKLSKKIKRRQST